MDAPLKLLIVEDSEDDALLVVRELRCGGYAPEFDIVETAEAMRRALEKQPWDIVISDYSLPGFDAPAALNIVMESGLDLPFIIVSGAIGEETAVETLRAGAHDYLMKGNLARLSAAVERELREAGLRQEQKRTEQRLLKSEKGFRDLFDSITDLIYTQDLDGRFITVNHAMSALLGYKKDEFIGRPASDFMKPEMSPFFQSGYLEPIKTKGSHEGVTCYFSKNGDEIYIDYHSSLVEPEDGSSYISGTGRDVTEHMLSQREIKRLQNQVHQSQKMEAIGLMAGGVAHDLNNILSGIVTYPELLLMDLPGDSPLRRPIKTIQESGMRAVDVVADLLTIARGVATGKEALNLNIIITEYLGSAEYRELGKTHSFVDFITELDPDLLNMSGSPTHIKKTLMNLIVNASEAIERSGTVTISSNNRYLDEPLKGYEDVRHGEYVVLSISDEGSGISPEDLERIFEPFYTKKIMGRSGTGLGLAVVWNTVQDHKGYINVKSSEEGTVFELYFPVTREQV
ncbi:MAG: PAS domain S-box protein, partial [Deltaproteobacteria bacterium]|nr:PAS domain S-box protein [Deltaproteobacteria bacterium]